MIERAARNFLAQLAALGLTMVDRLVLAGLLVRFWGTERFGDWALLLSITGLIFLGEAGLNVCYGNAWQKMGVQGDRAGVARLVRVALALAVAQGAILFSIVLLFVFFFSDVESDRLTMLLLGLAAIVNVMRGSVSQLYRVDGAFARGTLITMIPTLGTVLCGIGTALAGGGFVLLAALHLVVQLFLGWGLLFADLKRRYSAIVFQPAWPTRAEFAAVMNGVKWLVPQQMAPIVWLQAPLLILGAAGITGAPLAGFVLMRTLVGFSQQIFGMAAQAAALEFAEMEHRGEKAALDAGLLVVVRTVCVGAGASCAGLMIFGPSILTVWTGHDTLFDPLVTAWLALGAMFAAPATILANFLTFSGRPHRATLSLVAQSFSALSLAALLVPSYGSAGMAAGLALGEGVGLLFLLPRFPGRAARLMLATSLGSTLWCYAMGLLIARLWPIATSFDLLMVLFAWSLLGPLPPLLLALPARFFSVGLSRIRRSIQPAASRSVPGSVES